MFLKYKHYTPSHKTGKLFFLGATKVQFFVEKTKVIDVMIR